MKDYFEGLVSASNEIAADGDMRLHVVSSIRLLLQQLVFGMLEWASVQPSREGVFLRAGLASELTHASDGTLVDALEEVAIYCEQLGWQGASRPLFTPIGDAAPCRELCGSTDGTTSSLLRGMVRLRNDGAEGHGLPGDYRRDAERDCLRTVVEHLACLLPTVSDRGDLFIGPSETEVPLKFLRIFDGRPALLRSLKTIDSTRIRVDAQYQDKRGRRQATRFDAKNFLSLLGSTIVPSYSTWTNSWNPLCYLPERTTESFQGRFEEVQQLSKWMDDADSRTCL